MGKHMNEYTLYSEVRPFYEDLAEALNTAQLEISMMYLVFDHGDFSNAVKEILIQKVSEGVIVRLMVDRLGTIFDKKRNALRNMKLLNELKNNGIEVSLFQPNAPRLSIQDRMHIKLCAIDDAIVFVGGSNIGDEYLHWQDTNLKIMGDFGRSGHEIYDFVECHSTGSKADYLEAATMHDVSNWHLGDAKVLLTIPGYRRDICYHLIEMLLNSTSTIYFRQWYFLPNNEFMNLMLAKLDRNSRLEVMLSHRTKVGLVDHSNPFIISRLVNSGAAVYRYSERFMHSKIAWTDEGEIIIGSANMEERGLKYNFELCLKIKNMGLSNQLLDAFNRDIHRSTVESKTKVAEYLPLKKAIARFLLLFSPFL